PSGHSVQVRIRDGWVPARGPDHAMVVTNKVTNPLQTQKHVWLKQACPPLPSPQLDGCQNNSTSEWTAMAMSTTEEFSDGLDGCWPAAYNGIVPPPGYPTSDLP